MTGGVLVKLAVSRAAWDEIAARMRQARREERVSYAQGSIDMSEIALVVATGDIAPTYTKRGPLGPAKNEEK